MHQKLFGGRAPPEPTGGAYNALLYTLNWIQRVGPQVRGRVMRWYGRKGKVKREERKTRKPS